MCGIAGIASYHTLSPSQLTRFQSAAPAIAHRGPDAQGLLHGPQFAFAHYRLSIIDLDPRSNQPMNSHDGRYTLVFNGEIYNYHQLKQELNAQGISFTTTSDTEVLLQGYIAYGKKLLPHLNGFFAFAIYDHQQKSVFIARDQQGIKPLYYSLQNNTLFFASELAAISQQIEARVDQEQLRQYLLFNYVPNHQSMLAGVQQLAPGHSAEFKDNTLTIVDWRPHNATTDIPDYSTAKSMLRDRLFEAVEARLIADVPVATFLSGGIDSTIISGIAAQLRPDIQSYSIGFEQAHYDESPFAQQAAKHLGIAHHNLRLSDQDVVGAIQPVLDSLQEPFADSSALPVYLLSAFTAKRVKVVLSGDGADELFAGYHKHRAAFMMQQNGWMSKLVRLGSPLWSILPKGRNTTTGNLLRQLDRYAKAAKLSAADRYWRWAQIGDAAYLKQLLDIDSQAESLIYHQHDDELQAHLLNDQAYVLPGDMLVKTDRMSMLQGLELRTPFLDRQVVDLANALPTDYKMTEQYGKRILREAFDDFLPEGLFHRRKHGFEVPLHSWMTGQVGHELKGQYFEPHFIQQQGLFKIEGIDQLWKQLHSHTPGDAPARIWALVCFQHWYQKHISTHA